MSTQGRRIVTCLKDISSPSIICCLAVSSQKLLSVGKRSLYRSRESFILVISTCVTMGIKFWQGIVTQNCELYTYWKRSGEMRVARNMWRSSRPSNSSAEVNNVFTTTFNFTPTFKSEHFGPCAVFLNEKRTLCACYGR